MSPERRWDKIMTPEAEAALVDVRLHLAERMSECATNALGDPELKGRYEGLQEAWHMLNVRGTNVLDGLQGRMHPTEVFTTADQEVDR